MNVPTHVLDALSGDVDSDAEGHELVMDLEYVLVLRTPAGELVTTFLLAPITVEDGVEFTEVWPLDRNRFPAPSEVQG
jgi:hypothetical protein